MEALIEGEGDKFLQIFENIAKKQENVLKVIVPKDAFEETDLKWESFEKNLEDLDEKDMDVMKELVLKKTVNRLLPMNNDEDEEDGVKKSKDDLKRRLDICAVLLDFSYYLRFHMKDSSQCSVIYFEMFSHITELLNWPQEMMTFWDYTESRIQYFKCGNALELNPMGESQLISYKPPLFEKLRRWNEMLLDVDKRIIFNSPNVNEMKNKWLVFISELLPLHEESNFNRSATIASYQNSVPRPYIKMNAGRNSSQEEMFIDDYRYVMDRFVEAPFEYICSSFDQKLELDNVMSAIIDSLLQLEDEFYTSIRTESKNLSAINSTLNPNYMTSDSMAKTKLPTFMEASKKIEEINIKTNKEFLHVYDSIKDIPQPTAYDISLGNPDSLYQQMMILENDFYRKQFLIQVYFTCLLIEQILTKEDIYEFYKNNNSKTKVKDMEMFDRLSDQNIKKATLFAQHLMENRINKFYRFKDPQFCTLLRSLSVSEDCFVMLKLNGFKQFSEFVINTDITKGPEVDMSFKKFGFIKMGNKQINNVWKIETGFSNLNSKATSPKTLYEELMVSVEKSMDVEGAKDDIVKAWQILRSLRSQYLFEFSGFNENNGLKGLIDNKEVGAIKDLSAWKENAINTFGEPHRKKLEEAREYIKNKEAKKRESEQIDEKQNKKPKTESYDNISENKPVEDMNKNEEDPQSENPENITSNGDTSDFVSNPTITEDKEKFQDN